MRCKSQVHGEHDDGTLPELYTRGGACRNIKLAINTAVPTAWRLSPGGYFNDSTALTGISMTQLHSPTASASAVSVADVDECSCGPDGNSPCTEDACR